MFIVGLLSWWYMDGWKWRARIMHEHIESTLDYFSIDLLLKTLFSPFRQISAGSVRGPLEAQIRAFFDLLISRFIGAIVRLIMIFVGSLAITFHLLAGGLVLVLWGLVPFLPLIGMVLFILGWVPWSR